MTTVELNPQNAQNALTNLKKLGFEDRVKVVCSDALDFLKTLGDDQMFDFVFLDGAKGQYIKYLPYLKSHLNAGGVLFADDVLFYGMVTSHEKIAHKHRSIVNHLRDFLQTLQDDNDFETKIYDFDDGVSVSIKHKQI